MDFLEEFFLQFLMRNSIALIDCETIVSQSESPTGWGFHSIPKPNEVYEPNGLLFSRFEGVFSVGKPARATQFIIFNFFI
ncbi:MAG: hypothetical protein A2Y17_11910 [Clostridiales bacterium GWF2_38_85]|nr:MAG: hypothetical protein A2Y17_11910 [Clostridiales bacterium GWF2_38_85]HBL85407.1 hypothetical protein [Clostridiales bacterium]